MIGELIIKSALTLLTTLGFYSSILQNDLGEYTHPAKLTYIETSVYQQGNTLAFGNLIIELPDGVTAAEDLSDTYKDDGKTILLNGAEELSSVLLLPPQIRLTRYTVKYERKEALISPLLDLVQGAHLICEYADNENREYVFQLKVDYDDEYHYVIMRGEDLYLIDELEFEYTFSELRKQGKVKWSDSGEAVPEAQRANYSYVKIVPDEGVSFICYCKDTEMNLYIDGCYDNGAYMTYTSTGLHGYIWDSSLVDINFDGHTDICVDNDYMLIWNTADKAYVKVEIPDEMPSRLSLKIYPETKTIWGCRYTPSDYQIDRDYIETLWSWDGFSLIKKRECRAEVRGDDVRLWAYEETSDNVIFDESFTVREWFAAGIHLHYYYTGGPIQELYEQFYNGLVPKEFYSRNVPQGQEKIPQGLMDELKSAVLNSTSLDSIENVMSSNVLTDEEAYELAKINWSVRMHILASRYLGYSYIMLKADVDNDGIEDIIGKFEEIDSEVLVVYVLFKGQADGTYVETDSFDSSIMEFAIISYDGRNCLIGMYPEANGFSVLWCEEGTRTEKASISETEQTREIPYKM